MSRKDAIVELHAALAVISNGYVRTDGHVETNVHARIGYAESTLHHALALLGEKPLTHSCTQRACIRGKRCMCGTRDEIDSAEARIPAVQS